MPGRQEKIKYPMDGISMPRSLIHDLARFFNFLI